MNILVTGAAGFIGSHLCEALVERGHRVVGLDAFDDFLYPAEPKRVNARTLADRLDGSRFQLREASIGDTSAVSAAVRGVDAVCHLAALAGVQPSLADPRRYVETNLVGTTVVLEACRRAGVQRFVFGSSSSVYGSRDAVPTTERGGPAVRATGVAAFHEDDPCLRPASPYAATKRAGELLCSTARDLYGIGVSCLRFFTVYGPRQRPDMAIHRFVRAIAAGSPITLYGDGSSRRDYTFIGDIVRGVVAACERIEPGQFAIYNLGSTRTTGLAELVQVIERVVGASAVVRHEPDRPGDVPITFADVSRARRDLDYRPRVELGAGIEAFWRWLSDKPLSSGTTLEYAKPGTTVSATRNEGPFVDLLNDSLARVVRVRPALGDRFPTYGEGTRWTLATNDTWFAGFWPGLLWLTAVATNDRDVAAHAASLLPSFANRLTNDPGSLDHDIGFLYILSAKAQWRATGDPIARVLAVDAAEALARRFRERGRYIQAWEDVGHPVEGGRVIIDSLMNVPLLWWAADERGASEQAELALAHADTCLTHLVRPDGSTYHTFLFDQDTGEPIGPRTHQGAADDSLWARGQAWAIYGFALAAEWTGEQRFADAAGRAADRFLAELPAGGVPTWDLRLPAGAPAHLDSSAAAIAAAGLARLSRTESARTLVRSLASSCLETDPAGQGILVHGNYDTPRGHGVDGYSIIGDYFFVETLLALTHGDPGGRAYRDVWGPDRAGANHRKGNP